MADKDALSTFDFDQVSKPGLFLKFKADHPVVLRILTTDPVIKTQEFKDEKTGEISLNEKFHFIVYNFTEGRAQILGATPTIARKIGELHNDQDFGANIRNIDIKISPTGEKLSRKYDIQVLPKTNTLTNDMIKEAQAIDLDKAIENGTRMSIWTPKEQGNAVGSSGSPNNGDDSATDSVSEEEGDDIVIEDIGDEPINLDDIPF